MSEHFPGVPHSLAEEVWHHQDVSVLRCYQCGKCSAGCPLSADMDYPPSVIMRLLQTGLPEFEEKVLRSRSIWLCLSCETCYCRCPMEIDIPKVMDHLRGESLRQKKIHPEAKKIIAFHRAFLDSIHYAGRLYEVGLIAGYKARTFNLWQDVVKAPVLFLKGKLKPLPHLVHNRKALARMFKPLKHGKEVAS